MPRIRAVLAVFIATLLVVSATDHAGLAASDFQCNVVGGSPALVNACGARWEAANLRAHIANGTVQGAKAACLAQAAGLLERLASRWAASGVYTKYAGQWPCNVQPAIADDGTLERACPNAVWSYGDRGIVHCSPPGSRAAPQTARAPQASPNLIPAGESAACTAGERSAALPESTGGTLLQRVRDHVGRDVAPRSVAQLLDTVRVAVLGTETGSEVAVATYLGIFSKAGLDVTIQKASTGAAIAAAVASGAMDVGLTDLMALAVARAHGFSIVAIAPGYVITPPTYAAVMVSPASPLRSGPDFNGKTVAVSGLNTSAHVATMAMIDGSGGDARTVKFVELPSSALTAAIQRGSVDAAVMTRPFVAIAQSAGLKDLGNPYAALGTCIVGGAWFSTSDWAQSHVDIVHRFRAALEETAAWSVTHLAEEQSTIAKFTGLDAAALPGPTIFAQGMGPGNVQPLLDAATKFNVLTQRVSAADLIFP